MLPNLNKIISTNFGLQQDLGKPEEPLNEHHEKEAEDISKDEDEDEEDEDYEAEESEEEEGRESDDIVEDTEEKHDDQETRKEHKTTPNPDTLETLDYMLLEESQQAEPQSAASLQEEGKSKVEEVTTKIDDSESEEGAGGVFKDASGEPLVKNEVLKF